MSNIERTEEINVSELSQAIISSAQYEWAGTLACEMAHKFHVIEADFSVIRPEPESGENQLAVVYTHNEGIDLGYPDKRNDPKRSWDSIFLRNHGSKSGSTPRNPNFTFYVDGQTIDTRPAMTFAIYEAMIEQTKEQSAPPDDDRYDESGRDFLFTWLTGEKLLHTPSRNMAPYGALDSTGRAGFWRRRSSYDNWKILFRPAVMLEFMDAK